MTKILSLMILPVLNMLGLVLVGFSFAMLLPLAVSLLKGDGAALGFEVGFVITFWVGISFWACTNKFKRELIPRDGFLLVTLSWLFLATVATIPLYINIPDISFVHAFFEAVSGITTSCATVLSGLDSLPLSINFWRCFLSWLGGIGILVMAVAILPLLGVGGAQIFRAESSGPFKEGRLTPRIADTAKAFFKIYLAISIVCAFCYHFAGMDWDDAIMHTFTTVSLGGFSSHDAGFAYWSKRSVDFVCVIFLLIGGINFSMHFTAWKRLSLKVYFKDLETMSWLGVALLVPCVAAFFLAYTGTYYSMEDAIYYAITNGIFIVSTSGFSNADYGDWPLMVQIMLFLCGGFAACAGSTGGGIKMIRMIALLKTGNLEFKRILHPQIVTPLKIGKTIISSQVMFSVLAFLMLYIALIVIGTLVFLLTGLDGLTAFSTTFASLNNIGPALGLSGPAHTFGLLSNFQLLFCAFLMIVGRLEMFTVLVLFTRSFWRA